MSDLKDFVIRYETWLYKYTGQDVDIIIPDSVKNIGDRVFLECKNLENVVLPSNLERVGHGAFSKCRSLKKIDIPDSVKYIGDFAFANCLKLEEVKLPNNTCDIGINAFENCTALKHIIFPECSLLIGTEAFKNCKNLETVTMQGDNVHFYGHVFNGCDNLTKINAPDNAFEVIWKSFDKIEKFIYCLNLFKTKSRLRLKEKNYIVKNIDSFVEYAIKNDDIAFLSDYLDFRGKIIELDYLDSYIEKAQEKMTILAFLLDYKEKHYTESDIEKNENKKTEKILGLKEKTLTDWKKEYNFEITKGKKVIITKCKLKDAVINIPADILGNRTVEIGAFTFKGNKFIEKVIIPEGVTKIGHLAFTNCKKFTVVIPKSVTKIVENAFFECKKIEIIAPAGSYAEQYAKENNIPFVAE